MHLNKLLTLQVLYYGIALTYNAISYYLLSQEGRGLAPTDPGVGAMVMSLYAATLIPGYWKKIPAYRIFMGLWVILIGYSGVLIHILNLNNAPEVYYSITAGILAAGINACGWVLNLIAALGKFKIT